MYIRLSCASPNSSFRSLLVADKMHFVSLPSLFVLCLGAILVTSAPLPLPLEPLYSRATALDMEERRSIGGGCSAL